VLADVQQAMENPAAHPRDSIKAGAAREPERPARAHFAAHLDGVGAASGRPGATRRG
jgi:hypothetical protein